MSLILKLTAAILVGVVACSELTAEVLRPTPGIKEEEFVHNMSESGGSSLWSGLMPIPT